MEHILKIMEQFEKTSISTLKYKNDGEEILLTKNKNGQQTSMTLNQEDLSHLKEMIDKPNTDKESSVKSVDLENADIQSTGKESESGKDNNEHVSVESPIIGTFYRSPAPGKAPYVKKGDKISKGDVLCVVEAMKVMNKIESEFTGEIMDICLEDGEPVEYGTCLFKIKLE